MIFLNFFPNEILLLTKPEQENIKNVVEVLTIMSPITGESSAISLFKIKPFTTENEK